MAHRLTIFRGLPGSGKSTAARKLANKTGALHLEADMYHTRGGIYDWDRARLAHAHDWCLQVAREALAEGMDVIVANTFVTLKSFEPYAALADQYGAEVEVITCNGNFDSVHAVPYSTMERMRASWEA